MKMATQDLTSPEAANQLAAGAFFENAIMATQDWTSPEAAQSPPDGATESLPQKSRANWLVWDDGMGWPISNWI